MLPKPRRLFAMSCAVVVSLWLGGCREARAPENTSASAPSPVAASDSPKKKPPTDLEQLAQRLVNQSANIKEAELVLISGGAPDQELLENIAVQVRSVGAFPLVGTRQRPDRQTSVLRCAGEIRYSGRQARIEAGRELQRDHCCGQQPRGRSVCRCGSQAPSCPRESQVNRWLKRSSNTRSGRFRSVTDSIQQHGAPSGSG